jgi:hypothetical protein
MKSTAVPSRTIGIVVLVFMTATAVHAMQEPSAGSSSGTFENHGEVTVGYRFTDVKGYRPQYLQLFDLRDGFRVQDFILHGDSRESGNRFADGYSLSASGLGGDPFATADLKVAKTNLYDLRVQWRQSYYYRDQNDDVVLPITTVASGLSTGLTDNHDWSTVRKLGSASLTMHASNRLRFNVDFSRNTTEGSLRTTRSLDFFGSPSYWASFARANPYPLVAPLNDDTNRFTGGVDYSWRDWDFHYRAGFQTFNETAVLNPVANGEVSINPATLSTMEPLTQLSWSQTRRMTTPVSDFSFRGRLSRAVEWRGGYIYQRYRGPATFDASYSGIAPNAALALAPYSVSEGGRATSTEPYHALNQGLTWLVRNWWAVNADYRYSRYTSDTGLNIQSLFNGASNFGTSDTTWRSNLHDLSVNMVFTPRPGLVLSPGVRLSWFDIESSENGVVDEARTLKTNHVQPEIRFGYKPWSRLSFKGGVNSGITDRSYTAISPHTRVAGHLVTRFELLPNLSIEDTLRVVTAELIDSNYENRIRSNTVMLNYALDERFSAFAGMTYDSYFAQGDIVYARGAAPLTSKIRDQEIHRIWQAGIEAKPLRYLGFRVSANYDRLTGAGEILGEPPAYGPLTWPMGTGTVYVEHSKLGRLSLDLQRTYYIEELVTANNFSANLLMIRFTRGF